MDAGRLSPAMRWAPNDASDIFRRPTTRIGGRVAVGRPPSETPAPTVGRYGICQ